jgi:hypothetical protein
MNFSYLLFSVVGPDPDSIGALGSGFGYGSRKAKMPHKNRKKSY